MKQKFFAFFLGLFFVVTTKAATPEPIEWVRGQVATSPVLSAMQTNGREWRIEEARQLNQLKEAVRSAGADESLVPGIQAALGAQKTQAEAFLDALKSVHVSQKGWPLRTTKTLLNLDLALEKLGEAGWFASLLGMDFTAGMPEFVFADGGTRFDSSLGRAIKTTLTVAWTVLTEKTVEDLGEVFGEEWIKNAAFYVALPLPDALVASDYPWIMNYKGRPCLVEPHNGYVFGGGHGDEVLGELPGRWPAFDCSSLVARFIGIGGVAPSTLHWLLHAIEHTPEDVRPFNVAAGWNKLMLDWTTQEPDQKYRIPLLETVDYIRTLTSETSLEPGMIWVRRQFNRDLFNSDPADPSKGLYGNGGHMGLVLAMKDGKIIFMSGNRSMKETEGRDWDGMYWIENRDLPKEGDPFLDLLFKLKTPR